MLRIIISNRNFLPLNKHQLLKQIQILCLCTLLILYFPTKNNSFCLSYFGCYCYFVCMFLCIPPNHPFFLIVLLSYELVCFVCVWERMLCLFGVVLLLDALISYCYCCCLAQSCLMSVLDQITYNCFWTQ